MSQMPKIIEFVNALSASLEDSSFIKLSLGNYKGLEENLKKIHIKRILVKREEKLSFTYQYKTRDIVKNYDLGEGLKNIQTRLEEGFHAATLSTTAFTLALELFNNKAILKKSEAVIREAVSLDHDKNKKRLIEAHGKTYLHELKITDEAGAVYKNAQDKYRQINKYIEILQPLIKDIPKDKTINVVDMGSGKGYLTFALYDYLTGSLGLKAKVTGVEFRKDMVDLCNRIAEKSGFTGLGFVESGIEQYRNSEIDILIALHACDTATDDAIYKGIQAGAELIVVAPCCHKQIRREIENAKKDNDLEFLVKHGIFMERQAEMVTDGIRSLVLNYSGYTTKVFEFISGEHTAKNVMIIGHKNDKARKDDPVALRKIKEAKAYFGIGSHHLEKLLNI